MVKVPKPSMRRGEGADQAAAIDSRVATGFSLDADAALDTGREPATVDPRGFAPDTDEHERADVPDDYAGLGEHVVSVVKAADEAAAKIRQEAADDAARIAAASKGEANAILSEANHDADKLLFEVEQRRAEADRAADATRRAAEEYADQQRREAQEHASRLIAEADQEAARRAQATAERYDTLQDNLVRTEERLEQLVGGLRELAQRLEDVLGSRAPVEEGSLVSTAIADEPEQR